MGIAYSTCFVLTTKIVALKFNTFTNYKTFGIHLLILNYANHRLTNRKFNTKQWYYLSGSSYSFRWKYPNSKGSGKVSEFQPIPLSEEWLTRRLGFKPENYGTFYIPISKDQELWIKYYKNNDGEGWSVSIDFGDNMQHLIDTNFVHSLQNLYYALTNEEL